MTGWDMRLDVVRSLQNPQRWDEPGLSGTFYYCPVCECWYNRPYQMVGTTNKHTITLLCPMKHRCWIRENLNDPKGDA